MQTVVFVPLAHDISGEEINENAKIRCRMALWEAWETNRASNEEAVLAFGAGSIPRSDSQKTLSQYMEDYFVKVHADLPMIINNDTFEVYGTFDEIHWIINQAHRYYSKPRFVIISQARHIRRVKLMYRWFFKHVPMEFLVSDQAVEIPLWRECLSYLKLVLLKCGLQTMTVSMQRFTVRLAKW